MLRIELLHLWLAQPHHTQLSNLQPLRKNNINNFAHLQVGIGFDES